MSILKFRNLVLFGQSDKEISRRTILLIRGLGRGGAERLVAEEAVFLAEAGHSVEVWYQVAGEFKVELDAQDVCTRQMSNVNVFVNAFRLRRSQVYFHSHSPRLTALVSLALLASSRCCLLHTEHNMSSIYHPITRSIYRLAGRRVNKVVSVSEAVARSSLAPAKTQVVNHYRLNSPRLARCLSLVRVDSGEVFRLICVASLTLKKNHLALLDAIEEAKSRITKQVELNIVGDGPTREEIIMKSKMIERPDLRINVLGVREDIPELLSAASCLVLPSLSEGLPLVVLEAMAAGIPVIATAVGGVPELINNEVNGLLVDVGEVKQLSDAIVRLAMDDHLQRRLSASGREWIASRGGEDWREFYRQLMEEGC